MEKTNNLHVSNLQFNSYTEDSSHLESTVSNQNTGCFNGYEKVVYSDEPTVENTAIKEGIRSSPLLQEMRSSGFQSIGEALDQKASPFEGENIVPSRDNNHEFLQAFLQKRDSYRDISRMDVFQSSSSTANQLRANCEKESWLDPSGPEGEKTNRNSTQGNLVEMSKMKAGASEAPAPLDLFRTFAYEENPQISDNTPCTFSEKGGVVPFSGEVKAPMPIENLRQFRSTANNFAKFLGEENKKFFAGMKNAASTTGLTRGMIREVFDSIEKEQGNISSENLQAPFLPDAENTMNSSKIAEGANDISNAMIIPENEVSHPSKGSIINTSRLSEALSDFSSPIVPLEENNQMFIQAQNIYNGVGIQEEPQQGVNIIFTRHNGYEQLIELASNIQQEAMSPNASFEVKVSALRIAVLTARASSDRARSTIETARSLLFYGGVASISRMNLPNDSNRNALLSIDLAGQSATTTLNEAEAAANKAEEINRFAANFPAIKDAVFEIIDETLSFVNALASSSEDRDSIDEAIERTRSALNTEAFPTGTSFNELFEMSQMCLQEIIEKTPIGTNKDGIKNAFELKKELLEIKSQINKTYRQWSSAEINHILSSTLANAASSILITADIEEFTLDAIDEAGGIPLNSRLSSFRLPPNIPTRERT